MDRQDTPIQTEGELLTAAAQVDDARAKLAVVSLEGEVIPASTERIDLTTARHVRLEMAKVYREVRRGHMPSSEGSRLIYMLGAIQKSIESEREGDRMEAIERALRLRGSDD